MNRPRAYHKVVMNVQFGDWDPDGRSQREVLEKLLDPIVIVDNVKAISLGVHGRPYCVTHRRYECLVDEGCEMI